MAINFLQDISLNNGQVTNFKVQNITGTLPSSLSGEGQLIYKSDTNELYLHKGANSWEELSTGGSVTSVGITETGSALTITNSPITSSGNIADPHFIPPPPFLSHTRLFFFLKYTPWEPQ